MHAHCIMGMTALPPSKAHGYQMKAFISPKITLESPCMCGFPVREKVVCMLCDMTRAARMIEIRAKRHTRDSTASLGVRGSQEERSQLPERVLALHPRPPGSFAGVKRVLRCPKVDNQSGLRV